LFKIFAIFSGFPVAGKSLSNFFVFSDSELGGWIFMRAPGQIAVTPYHFLNRILAVRGYDIFS
jgi:hypothetical protein